MSQAGFHHVAIRARDFDATIKFYNEGKMAEALTEFNKVVGENPNLPDAYYYRGLAYLASGKSAEAKADFQKLLDLDPKHANADEAREFLKSM